MARRRRGEPEPHELDHRTTDELYEAACGHDLAGWAEQRQAFTELRDLSGDMAGAGRLALNELRESWSGTGAEAFAAEFSVLIDFLSELQTSAAVNADGMGEVAVVATRTRDRAEELYQEDQDWKDNPDGDDELTIKAMRDSVHKDLRDAVKEAAASYQHLHASYLTPPPEPPLLGGIRALATELHSGPGSTGPTDTGDTATSGTPAPTSPRTATDTAPAHTDVDESDTTSTALGHHDETVDTNSEPGPHTASGTPTPPVSSDDHPLNTSGAEDTHVENAGTPTAAETPALQTTTHHGQPVATTSAVVEPAPVTGPVPAEPPPAASAPMMPVGGAGMAGEVPGGPTTGNRSASTGPTFDAARNVEPSRMRSHASRQDLHNQLLYGKSVRPDPDAERRAVHTDDDDSPFVPERATVVPPVITGSVDDETPHESGPVVANTIPQRFPDYGHEAARPGFVEEYEDGSIAEIEFGDLDDTAAATDGHTEDASGTASRAIAQDEAAESAVDERLMSTRLDFKDYWHAKESLPPDKIDQFTEAQQKLRQPEGLVFPAEPDTDASASSRDEPDRKVQKERRRGRAERLRAKWQQDNEA